MSISIDQFIQDLIEHKILTQQDIESVCEEGKTPEDFESSKTLAEALVKVEKLTKFQANVAYAGKTRLLVIGDYHILKKIAEGGMGQVFKAQHRLMKRIVAIKVLSKQATRSSTSVQRFYREVEAAAKLNHPNIVTAYDAGEHTSGLYFVMEYVQGLDLAELLKKKRNLPWDSVLNFIIQAAKGLAFAHTNGMTHRDIKPANLLLDKSGAVKILDMGLVKLDNDDKEGDEQKETSDEGLTAEGRLVGTVEYMAPEHVINPRNADHRSDIYSLGCTMFRLITGVLPFKGKTPMETAIAQREKSIPKLADHMAQPPEGLQQVLAGMLAKDPEHRYQTMEEVIQDLQSIYVSAGDWEASAGDPGDSASLLSRAAHLNEDPSSSSSSLIPLAGPATRGEASDGSGDAVGRSTISLLEGGQSSSGGTMYEPSEIDLQLEPESKNRVGVVVGALVALGVVAGLLGMIFSGGKPDPVPTPGPTTRATQPQNPTPAHPTPTRPNPTNPTPGSKLPPPPTNPRDPWFHWKMDGDTSDSVGGLHGVVRGSLRGGGAPGRLQWALNLNASGYIETAHDPKIDLIRDAMTVTAWVRIPARQRQSAEATIIAKGGDSWRLGLANRDSGQFQFAIGKKSLFDGKRVQTPRGSRYRDDKWHHLAGVYDGQFIRLFVDGKPVASAAYNEPIPANIQPITIGANASAPFLSRLHGIVDDLRLYGVALNAREIRMLASMGSEVVPGLGQLVQDIWTNTDASGVADLNRVLAKQPIPDQRFLIRSFRSRPNSVDRYVQRIRALLHPPVTGEYIFWITGDEQSELYLSTDDTYLKKRLIASTPSATEYSAFDEHPQQKSQSIRLEGGKRYYIEARQWESTGTDHVLVGWTLPDGSTQRPIAGLFLSLPPQWQGQGPSPRLVGGPGPVPTSTTPTPTPPVGTTPATPPPIPQRRPPFAKRDLLQRGDLRPGQWLNLIPMLDPGSDIVAGGWTIQKGALIGSGIYTDARHQLARFRIPMRPLGDYELEVRFRRIQGNDAIHILFPVGSGGWANLCLAGYSASTGTPRAGLENIDGASVGIKTNPTQRPLVLKTGQAYTAKITVKITGSKANVQAHLEGVPIVRWSGPASDLKLPATFALGSQPSIAVATQDSKTVFDMIRLAVLRGSATFYRAPPRTVVTIAPNPPQPGTTIPPKPTTPDPPKPRPDPVDNRPAKVVFAEKYAAEVKAAKKSPDTTDNITIASVLIKIAHEDTVDAKLTGLMGKAALELTASIPEGLDLALEATDLVAEAYPEQAADVRLKATTLLRSRYVRAKGPDKLQWAERLVDTQIRYGDDFTNEANALEARRHYTSAQRVAKTNRMVDVDALIRIKLARVKVLEPAFRKIAPLKAKLLKNPDDAEVHKQLFQAYLLDLDNPAEAMTYVDLGAGQTAGRMTEMAANDITGLSKDDLTSLSKWYEQLSTTVTSGVPKSVALQRAELYQHGFLMLHRTQDATRTKAAASLKKLEESVDRLARQIGKTKVPMRWVDILQSIDTRKHIMGLPSSPWQRKGSQLTHQSLGTTRYVRIPFEPNGHYRLRVKFKLAKSTNLRIHLPIGDNVIPFQVRIDGVGSYTYMGTGAATIIPDKEHVLDFSVRHDDERVQITTDLNGKPYYQWSGMRQFFRRPGNVFALQPPQTFTLGSTGPGIIVYTVHLKMLSGSAHMFK